MPYRVGYCAQCCNEQLMVRDTVGKWTTRKPNFRQADLSFGDGSKITVALCVSCLSAPNYMAIIDSVTHNESNVGDENLKSFIKSKGVPVGHRQV